MNKMKNFILDKMHVIFIMFMLVFSSSIILTIILKLNCINTYNLKKVTNEILFLIICFVVLVFSICIIGLMLIRNEVKNFSNRMIEIIEKIINKEENIEFNINEESLLSKLENKFKQLLNILDNDRNVYLKEKDSIKSLISDISHQIKTPITNIAMYNDTLIERELEKEKEKIFLRNMRFQVSKLEWLVQSLIKMSRLESNIIAINKEETFLKDTIIDSLKGIYLKADRKNINLVVSCCDEIKLCHDKKWTSEAIFNIVENAVKYTDVNGTIEISVDKWDLFTKIDIKDTGIGIEDTEINNIFKRFYRGREVIEFEGVGIGLYLANEIITKQGGYIKVKSKKNEGSTFSIFLSN